MATREIPVRIIETPDAIPALLREWRAAAGPFARVAVVVPGEPLRHRIRAGCGDLAGVRFCSAADLAADVVVGHGIGRRAGAEQYAALTVEALLAGTALEGALDYFQLGQLRSGAGYADALARTITELAGAGLEPGDLRAGANRAREGEAAPGRMLDLAAIWEALGEQDAGNVERTRAELLREATELTASDPSRAAAAGPVAAWVSEQTSNMELRFLSALPDLTVWYQTARPIRPESTARLQHVARLLGLPEQALADPPPPAVRDDAGELERLQQELFLPPGATGAETGSAGPDGSVRLEEYAGVEDELAAAAEWVADQVRRGRALEDVAVLVPAIDPYAMMLVERLAELPWGDTPATYVDGGLPVAATPKGARLVAVLDGLQDALSADAMSRLLPYVRFTRADGHHTSLTFAQAMELVWSCGTLGGLAGKAEGAADWSPAFARLEAELTLALERANAAGAQDEDLTEARGGAPKEVLERRLETIRGVRPAVDALVQLHALVLDERGVREVWRELRELVRRFILHADPVELWPRLGRELDGFLDSTLSARVGGRPAVRIIREAIDSVRQGHGRFGEPRCYIGTIAGAAGLAFDAVRVLGLSEGAFPARPAVDPILPDTDRRDLEPGERTRAVPRRDDRPWLDFRAFHRVVRGARHEVVLSVPRQGIDGSVREASGLLLEVAAALRRPIGESGERSAVPTLSDLRRGYFRDPTQPVPLQLAPRAVACAVATRPAPSEAVVPGSWLDGAGAPAADLLRIRELLGGDDLEPGATDGLLGGDHPLPREIGRAPEHAISASRLKTLLECPHRFLLERVLRWEEPAGAPESREIGQPDYGGLVHRILEEFFTHHGTAFTARDGSLDDWLGTAREVADAQFDTFLQEYALLDGPVRDQQRRRACEDVRRFLTQEWDERPGLAYAGVEQPFGYPNPIPIELGDGATLFVHGYIDRLDTIAGDAERGLFIRDYKTGRAHPKAGDEAVPVPKLDIQLVVYGLAAEAMRATGAAAWGPLRGVAYVYPDEQRDAERAWEGSELAVLLDAGRGWLRVAHDLLAARAFPRTPNPDDCAFCPFQPVCGPDAPAEAAVRLAGVEGPVASYLAAKLPPAPDGEAQ